jgi:pimeloyl-ACP methyl ester carboxylesterase
MKPTLRLALGTLCLVLSGVTAMGARAERLSLETRPGASVMVDLELPAEATALILLFEGGGGRIKASSKGFASLAHQRLAGFGMASALIDAPSDKRQFMGGMHPNFRQSDAHLRDINAVVAALRARSDLPLWVLGISLGSRSAAWYAASGSRAAEVRTFSGGSDAGRRACGVRTHHTFYGIEDEVLAAIADFIMGHTP